MVLNVSGSRDVDKASAYLARINKEAANAGNLGILGILGILLKKLIIFILFECRLDILLGCSL